MKALTLFLAALTSLFISACAMGDRSNVKADLGQETAKVREDAQRKNAFIDESQSRIAEIEHSINGLDSAQLRNTNENTKQDAVEARQEAVRALDAARADLKDLREAEGDRWTAEQRDFLTSMKRLEERYANAKGYYQAY